MEAVVNNWRMWNRVRHACIALQLLSPAGYAWFQHLKTTTTAVTQTVADYEKAKHMNPSRTSSEWAKGHWVPMLHFCFLLKTCWDSRQNGPEFIIVLEPLVNSINTDYYTQNLYTNVWASCTKLCLVKLLLDLRGEFAIEPESCLNISAKNTRSREW